MAEFEARALTIHYGDTPAIDQLDLRIAPGEIFVLLGGSGSGKTTLLRCIGGFLPQSEGVLLLGGQDISNMPAHRRPVNTMFQSYALFPHMSVARNIGFGVRGLRRADRDARVSEMLDLVSMSGFGARRVTELSGGQQQRVALARSLAPRPGLLLLDEPFSALDAGLRDATRREFLSVLRKLGTTVIMVTHDQDEALSSADRIGILHGGRLVQVGPPAELYERPANRLVATFLGAANVIELPGRTIAVRPERIRLGRGAPGDTIHAGVVEAVSYRGSALDVSVRLPDGALLRVSQPLSDGLSGTLAVGMRAEVSWPAGASIVLPE